MMKGLILLLLAIVALPAIGILTTASKPETLQDEIKTSMARGKTVYDLNCASCHQTNGEGLPSVYPPLAKSDHLTKDQTTSIGILLSGQNEEITVNGVKYNIPMSAFNHLTDEQIADVLNYIGKSWGNQLNTVTPAQVKSKRK